MLKVEVKVSDNCNLCGLCERFCPAGVFKLEGGRLRVYESECIYCKGCEAICPVKALHVRALDEGLVVFKGRTLMSSRRGRTSLNKPYNKTLR